MEAILFRHSQSINIQHTIRELHTLLLGSLNALLPLPLSRKKMATLISALSSRMCFLPGWLNASL